MANALAYSRITRGVYDTKQFASTLGPFLRPGDIVMLNGDLGAGKTQFVQGVAQSLGIAANVVSPTFNIVLEYAGDEMPLYHFDLYRLESRDELEDIGYWEILEGEGVSFIEWGSKFPHSAPLDYLEVRIEQRDYDMRTIICQAHGQRARRLLFLWSCDDGAQLDPYSDSKLRI